jgi:hypothetical protein
MEILVISAMLVLVIVAFFGYQLLNQQSKEGFVSYLLAPSSKKESVEGNPKGIDGLAPFPNGQQAILDRTLDVGLGNLGAAGCAAIDQSRELEIDGQYVQRTNNYQRQYPDNCSAPLTEFVGSVYKEKRDVGLGVPCKGRC